MKVASLPAQIHIDPNMRPDFYANLLHFALVFDKISLYAVSGRYLEAMCPLTLGQFFELVKDPSESPFLLTAPSDWYDKHIRAERLNPLVTAWHAYDDEIAANRNRYGVVTIPSSPSVRDLGWDATLRYRDKIIVGQHLDQPDYEGPGIKVHKAFVEARSALIKDRQRLQQTMAMHSNPDHAALTFQSVMPATFLHDQIHSPHYQGLLKEGDALSCLIFEHLTKPLIISRIEQEAKSHKLNFKFAMFAPAEWHRYLLAAVEIGTTADLIVLKRKIQRQQRFGSLIAENSVSLPVPSENIVTQIKKFRSAGGPAALRHIISDNLADIGAGVSASDAMPIAFGKLERLCEERYVDSQVLRGLLSAALIYGGYLMGLLHSPEGTAILIKFAKELWSYNVPKRIVETWARSLANEDFVLLSLNSWLRSGQPFDRASATEEGDDARENN